MTFSLSNYLAADFAEAGGKDPSKIDAMLAEGRLVIEKMLA